MNGLRSILGALVAVTLAAPAASDTHRTDAAVPDAYAKACTHYVNRARFKERTDTPEFVVVLADSCTAALTSLESDRPEERATAAGFLMRLLELRDTVIAINMDRLFGENYNRFTRIKGDKINQTEAIAQVSATGEYLIAYRLGLIAARKAWLDTDPDFAFGPARKG